MLAWQEREQSACWWPLTNTRLNTNIEVHNKFGKCSFLGEPIGKSDVMQSFFSMSSTQTKHSRNIHQKMKKKKQNTITLNSIHTHTYKHQIVIVMYRVLGSLPGLCAEEEEEEK